LPTSSFSKILALWWPGRLSLGKLTLDRFLVGVMLIIIFAAAACTRFQSDSWWNLRSGQLIWQTGQVWNVDPFSSTARGAPWPNHEWLTQLTFYVVYLVAGLGGVVLLCAAIAAATWLIIYRLCAGPPRYRVLLLLLAVTSHEIVWAVRPHMVTLLLLALTLWLIRRRALHWLLPPLFLLWANLHGGVVMGGLALVAATGAALLRERRDFLHWVSITLACAAATLINPMGLGLWHFALSMFNHPETQYIQEWLPPSLDWPLSYPFFILAIAWLAVVGLRWRRLCSFDDWTLVLLGAVLLLLGFRAVRHTALFTVAALPLISQALTAVPRSSAHSIPARRGALHLALGGVVALSCVLLIARAWGDYKWMGWEPFSPNLIAAVRDCPGPLYNSYDSGGPILWFIPERAVFVDSRNDPYPLDLLLRAVITEQRGDYRQLFQTYNVACALVPVQKPIYPALRQDAAWRELYRDRDLAVLHRADSLGAIR
jgi:hypothetical protein